MFNLPIKILEKQELTAEAESVTFSNIDTLVAAWDTLAGVTSRHLVLIINARSIDVSDYITNFLRFNGDSGMNYLYQRLSGVDAADSAGRVDGANAINLPPIPGDNTDPAMAGSMVLIPHAFNTTNHKAVLALGGAVESAIEAVAARWASVAAITSATVFEGVGDDFAVGSTFLIGVVDERYLLEEIEDSGSDFSPTFDDIPQLEGDLVVVGYARSDQAAVEDEVIHAINDDSVAGNYPAQELTGIGGATAAAQPNQECAMVSGDNATANVFGALVATYSQYIKRNQPHFLSASGYHETSGPTAQVRVMSGRRSNTEPMNKLAFNPNAGTDFKAGSLFSLYLVPKRLIGRVELQEDTATITFSDIPQDFEALVLNIYTRSDQVGLTDDVLVEFNGDAVAANYDWQRLYGQVAAVIASRNAASQRLVPISGSTEGAGEFAGGLVTIPGYSKADRYKHILSLSGRNENIVFLRSARWEDTSAITQIILTPEAGTNFVPGSVFELWGILPREGLPASSGMKFGE